MAAQAGLCLAWSETAEDTFCLVVAHLYYCISIKSIMNGIGGGISFVNIYYNCKKSEDGLVIYKMNIIF